MHPAPDPPVVTVRARLRNAGVRAARLSGGRQHKRLCVIEVAEQNSRGRAVLSGVPGRIFRVRGRGDQRQPGLVVDENR